MFKDAVETCRTRRANEENLEHHCSASTSSSWANQGRRAHKEVVVGPRSNGKGSDFEWTATQVVSDIAKTGYTRVVSHSDQEPDITARVDKIMVLRTEETIVEWSPAYDKVANGMAERGVQAVEGPLRTLRYKIPVDHPLSRHSTRS